MKKIAERMLYYFEQMILTILITTLLFGVAYSTYLGLHSIYTNVVLNSIATAPSDHSVLQDGLYKLYGSFLTILLGLELIHTVKVYFKENHIKIESIFVISILAISRHIIQLHMDTVDPFLLIGLALLMGVLIAGYLLLRKNLHVLKDGEIENKS